MLLLEKNVFEEYMKALEKKIMARFDCYEKLLKLITDKEPTILDGEHCFDNQDLCKLLNINKRTLARYRASKTLPYHLVYNRAYYKESDVHNFMNTHFKIYEENIKKREKNLLKKKS